jgi:hypothetical protein
MHGVDYYLWLVAKNKHTVMIFSFLVYSKQLFYVAKQVAGDS